MDIKTNTVLKNWEINEYKHHERSRRWYIVSFGVFAVFLILSIWSQNIFAAVAILLLSVILLVRVYTEPPRLSVSIYDNGLLVGESFFEFKDLDNFWIAYEPPDVKMLYIEFNNFWRPRLPVPLEDEDPVEIRSLLIQFLNENTERENEPLSDYISRLLKL